MDTIEWLKREMDEQWVNGNAFGMTTPKERGKVTSVSFLDHQIVFEFEKGDRIEVRYDQIDELCLEKRNEFTGMKIIDRKRNRWFFSTVNSEVATGAVKRWRMKYSLIVKD